MKAIINGIHLAYTDQGQGLPLIFLHALPLSKDMWQPQVRILANSYRVITIDFRGHEESDALLWNFTLEKYVNDVIGRLDHLNISQPVFIGIFYFPYTFILVTLIFGMGFVFWLVGFVHGFWDLAHVKQEQTLQRQATVLAEKLAEKRTRQEETL